MMNNAEQTNEITNARARTEATLDEQVNVDAMRTLSERLEANRKAHKDDPEPPHHFALNRKAVGSNHGELIDLGNGIGVSKHAIDSAVKTTTFDDPLEHDAAVHKRREAERKVGQRLNREFREDLEISKQITATLQAQVVARSQAHSLAEDTLCLASQREHDKGTLFVNVTNEKPLAAASRVLNLKNSHPNVEIKPIDLSNALEGTRELTEHHIDKLEFVMHVKKHCDQDDLPEQIRFAIPNVDLPIVPEVGGNVFDPVDVTYEMARYVHLNSMPEAMKNVVQAYLTLRGTGVLGVKRLKETVAELNRIVSALPDNPETPVIVKRVEGNGCVEPHDVMGV